MCCKNRFQNQNVRKREKNQQRFSKNRENLQKNRRYYRKSNRRRYEIFFKKFSRNSSRNYKANLLQTRNKILSYVAIHRRLKKIKKN